MSNPATFDAVLRRMAAIHKAKNADYGSSYHLVPALLGIPAHVGILVRITDTLLDLANYAVLAILALESPPGERAQVWGLMQRGIK